MATVDNGPPVDDIELGSVLSALSDPHRRRVVAELAADPNNTERNCSTFELPLAKSTQTHLFKVLTDTGLIVNTDYGNRKGVLLRRADLDRRFPGLLDILAAELEH